MQFVIFIGVIQMFLWRARNAHFCTIGKSKTYEFTQWSWYFLHFRHATLILVCNGFDPQLKGNLLLWTMQGLNLGGMIWGNDGNKYFKNFTNGCFLWAKNSTYLVYYVYKGFYERCKVFLKWMWVVLGRRVLLGMGKLKF
jgi:hypothetical protein